MTEATTPLPGAPALDHLVIAADTLEQGVRWCEGVLGVTPGPGGRHPLMGTHNRLLRLAGPWPGAYLEIIAIDPAAPKPAHARWFGLDERPRGTPPALVHWVLRCEDLETRCAALRSQGQDPGLPVAASRATPQGELRWRITCRDDGRPQLDGALPTLIQWQGAHPTATMPPGGVALQAVAAGGLPPGVRPLVSPPGLGEHPGPGLAVTLIGTRGPVQLSTAADDRP